ncbi:DUF418 domain-containing protein [Streptomyces sp. ZAF1911]|uniref:DUF418 domain-containing protein n=1 Tax=Streptomyces sp. ZAF1911 TaxID=2944129 RepID=UPI00237B44C3|nr:DUF418 domain-containing protein [Streptomyces sp. ZAF1911]MDD9375800.1 DUF418 domain-containing protein [Streptomyces sp. ZAF1911]
MYAANATHTGGWRGFTALFLAGVILLAQSLFARAWLRRFRYGPLEWGRRCAKWWERVPLRRPAV